MNPEGRVARTLRAGLLRGLRPAGQLRGLRVVGGERLPVRPEPLVLACNHAAFADTFWLHLALPHPPAVCGAKPRLFRSPALRGLMGLADIRRIDNEAGFHETAGALLARGRTLLVYPEMGRNPDGMGDLKPWLATLLLAHRAPVLPMYLWGTTTGEAGGPRLHVGHHRAPAGDPTSLTAAIRADLEALRAEAACC